jgi:hypothetical protein
VHHHHWLELASWASQVLLTLIALVAALAAVLQLRAFKLLEVLKLLEGLKIREARRTALKEIFERTDPEWWNDEEHGKRLEAAASDVCASYDILGLMIEHDPLDRFTFGYGRFFKKYWAASILECHRALKGYVEYRRKKNPEAYSGFTRLAKAARRYAHL